MRLIRSLKSTHWVMWSSPLLLLVLVFTLTSDAVKGVEPVVIAHHGDSLDHDVARLGEGHHYDDLAREGPVDRETQARSDRDLDARLAASLACDTRPRPACPKAPASRA